MDTSGDDHSGSLAPSHDPFDAAWREVEARWDDEAAHKKFIAFCAAQGALAEAGRRYRDVRDNDPARSDDAKKRIDAVLGAAMQNMQLSRESVPRRNGLTWIAFGLCGFLLVYALLTLLRARSH